VSGMTEGLALAIVRAAIDEGRAAELIDCLFDGGSATVDADDHLVLAPAEALAAMVGTPGLLSEDELLAMEQLGTVAGTIRRIIGTGSQAGYDWGEAADKIHQLQAMVMAQAAARAYPDQFRPLGGWPA
jgi:hypothetical protein